MWYSHINANFGKIIKLKWMTPRIWCGMTWQPYYGKTICQHAEKYASSTNRVKFLWCAQIHSETSQWQNCHCHSIWTWKWAKTAILTHSWSFKSEQFCPSHCFWFRIITKTLWTCSDQGPDPRSRKGAPTSDHTTM